MAKPEASGSTRRRKWWNGASRVQKVIVGAGTLAGAIAAIVGLVKLWPSSTPDQQDAGQLRSIRVTTGVPLSEFERRQAAAGSVHTGSALHVRALTTAADDGQSSEGPADTSGAESSGGLPTNSSSGEDTNRPTGGGGTSTTTSATTGTPSESASSSTSSASSSSTSPAPPEVGRISVTRIPLPPTYQRQVATQDPCKVLNECFQVAAVLVGTTKTDDGKTVTPAQAAENIVQVLAHTRTVRTESSPRPEPQGAEIHADVELDGLRGKQVELEWSIWQVGGATRLYDRWLSTHSGYELTPTTERDTGSFGFWVPLPQATGKYFVRLALKFNDTELASADSSTFA